MRKYQQVIEMIHRQIDANALPPGSRAPSIREMSERTGFSAVTVQHAYVELEGDGVLVAKPRSGFYVSEDLRRLSKFPLENRDSGPAAPLCSVETALFDLCRDLEMGNIVQFGSMAISQDLLPHGALANIYLQVARSQFHAASRLSHSQGHPELREAIAKRISLQGRAVHSDEIVVTGSVQRSLTTTLEAITVPGDNIVVESPSHPAVFCAARKCGLNMIEIYSHPTFGVSPDQFEHLLSHNVIRACLLNPSKHFPTGISYSSDALANILRIVRQHRVQLIDFNLYGDLVYPQKADRSLFAIDDASDTIEIGSFRGILGERFALSWIVSSRMTAKVSEANFYGDPICGLDALQQAIARYILRRGHVRQMRSTRQLLDARVRRGLGLISQLFPEECAVSRPDGGYMCWVRGPSSYDSISAARWLKTYNVSIAPGPLFSLTRSFRNHFALNLSFDWDVAGIERLKLIRDSLRMRTETAQ